jgi:hypothetical protein
MREQSTAIHRRDAHMRGSGGANEKREHNTQARRKMKEREHPPTTTTSTTTQPPSPPTHVLRAIKCRDETRRKVSDHLRWKAAGRSSPHNKAMAMSAMQSVEATSRS